MEGWEALPESLLQKLVGSPDIPSGFKSLFSEGLARNPNMTGEALLDLVLQADLNHNPFSVDDANS